MYKWAGPGGEGGEEGALAFRLLSPFVCDLDAFPVYLQSFHHRCNEILPVVERQGVVI